MHRIATTVLLLACVVTPSLAQVGHPPGRTPYRDIVRSQTLSAGIGYVGGSRGLAGVGPSSGLSFGARYEIRLSGPTDIVFSLASARTDRFVVDPLAAAEERRSGPVDQSVFLGDVGLVFLLTGPKTWHGLAPYVGTAFGIAIASSTPADSSGYQFGTKFTIQPTAGVRYYATRSVYVRLEARDLLWQLRYPASFSSPPPGQPNAPTLLPAGTDETQWTHHLWLSLGIGIAFRL